MGGRVGGWVGRWSGGWVDGLLGRWGGGIPWASQRPRSEVHPNSVDGARRCLRRRVGPLQGQVLNPNHVGVHRVRATGTATFQNQFGGT